MKSFILFFKLQKGLSIFTNYGLCNEMYIQYCTYMLLLLFQNIVK